jgi:hypothetical protein
MTRPTTPRPAITAMFGSTPSSLPRSIVTVSAPGDGLPAMTRAASVLAARLFCRFSASSSELVRLDLARSACSSPSSSTTRWRSAALSRAAPCSAK